MATVNKVIENNLNVTVKYILQKELGSMRKNFSAFDISQVSLSLFDFFILVVGFWNFKVLEVGSAIKFPRVGFFNIPFR